jgi:hypothetical protein
MEGGNRLPILLSDDRIAWEPHSSSGAEAKGTELAQKGARVPSGSPVPSFDSVVREPDAAHERRNMHREPRSLLFEIVVASTATSYSIADPNDGGMLDVVGFDSAPAPPRSP